MLLRLQLAFPESSLATLPTYLWHFDWQTNNATAFPNPFPNFYNLTIRVLAVSGANVTFTQTVFLTNGTGGGVTDVVNVQTQDLCISNGLPPNQGPPVCGGEGLLGSAILAAGLQAPQAIGANPSVFLNQTVARTILGAQRTLNFLNETTSSSPQTTAFSIAWDQTSEGSQLERSFLSRSVQAKAVPTGPYHL